LCYNYEKSYYIAAISFLSEQFFASTSYSKKRIEISFSLFIELLAIAVLMEVDMKDSYKKIILFTTSLGAFIIPFMTSSVNIALPAISNDLPMNSILLNRVALSYTLFMAIFVLPFGKLADILGRKKLLLIGLILFTAASIICGISNSANMLIAGRIFQGISSATITVTVVSILTSVYPTGKRGKALGLNVAMTYVGLSTGPYLGGLLTKYFGWRSIFTFIAFIGLIVIVSLLTVKQDWKVATVEKFDGVGSAIFALSVLLIITGFSWISTSFGWLLILLGIAAAFLFVIIEKKVQQPVLDIELLKGNRVLFFSSLAALINYSATFAVSYLLSLYLQIIKGYDPAQAGLVLMAQPVVMAILSPLAGIVSDRIHPIKVASMGMAITTLGLTLFIFLQLQTGIVYIVSALVVIGFGFAFFTSPNTNAIMSSVENRYYGVVSGILGSARTIGQTLSMGLATSIITISIGSAQMAVDHAPELLSSIKVIFTVISALCFSGIFVSFAGKSMSKKESKNEQ
jgi:EmrB/QacA subfamily drug resistance transporter